MMTSPIGVVHDPRALLAMRVGQQRVMATAGQARRHRPAQKKQAVPVGAPHASSDGRHWVSANGQTTAMLPEDVATTAEDEKLYARLFAPRSTHTTKKES